MNLRPLTVAAVVAVSGGVAVATGAGAAEKPKTATKIIKRVVIVQHGHKVTVTTFTKNGKTYKRKQWKTRKAGKLVYHSYTYLVRGKKAAKATASEVKASMDRQCAPGDPAAIAQAINAFWAHFGAAHLNTSLGQQVADALNVDDYVKLHTVLVDNMLGAGATDLGGLPPALQELLDIFEAHFVAAHLNTSPEEQVQQITSDPDGYIKLHTALVANMLAPLQAWADKYGKGSEERCTDVPAGTSTSTAAKDVAVDIKDNKFPANIDVATGSKVTWTNQDSVLHTVTSMHGGPLKSGTFGKGQSYSYTFTTAGTYMYVCDVHPDMQGTVTVK